MKRKKDKNLENYLERIPLKNEDLLWKADDDNKIAIMIENKGIFNRIAQKMLKKPRISYIHLDDMGSFIWPLIDGKRNLIELGKLVDEHFGDDAKPLYERLSKFFQILEIHRFIKWKQS